MAEAFEKALRSYQAGDRARARSYCETALIEAPKNAKAHELLAVLVAADGDTKRAARLLTTAVELSPSNHEIRLNLAKALRDLGHNHDAKAHLTLLTEAWPDRADVWLELGVVLNRAQDLHAAAGAIATAVSLGANDAKVLSNLASIYIKIGDLDAAESAAQQAIESDPNYTTARINLGVINESRDQVSEAVLIYDGILSDDPSAHTAESRRALALLTLGDLEQGWKAYAQRHKWPGSKTCTGQNEAPPWDGSDLSDRSIVIWTEQGLGDEILCGTMISEVVEQAGTVAIACSERLHHTFTRSFPTAQVAIRDDTSLMDLADQTFDFQASVTELGAALRPKAESFRSSAPFLVVDEDRVEDLKSAYRKTNGRGPLIGVSWQSANAETQLQKSSDLVAWSAVLAQQDATFVSLQYGNVAPQLERLRTQTGRSLFHDPEIDPVVDFDAFVHQVAAMDLVISTSNTTVHVAGALGKPVWNIVPQGLGRPWYWFIDRNDSLWYPTMKIYRQTSVGDWDHPLGAIARDISPWITRWPDQP